MNGQKDKNKAISFGIIKNIDLAPFTILEQFRGDKQEEEINTDKDLLESGIIWGAMTKIKELIHEVG
jgi:hypothetical protein